MKNKKSIMSLTVLVILLSGIYLAACGKTETATPTAATNQTAEEVEEMADAAEKQSAEEVEEAVDTAEKQSAEGVEEAAATNQTPEEAEESEQPEVSEEERLADFAKSLEELDPVKERNFLNSELVRVKNEEEDASYQNAVIQRMLAGKTNQGSPCQVGEYPIVRIFKGFVLVDSDGRVIAYQDSRHLHFKDEGWKILDGHGIETIEDNAIVWRLGDFPFWVLAQKGEQVYLLHWLEKADAEDDPVFSRYNADIRQRVKAIVAESTSEGKVSQENYNLLESIAFQLAIKEVSSKDYCIVQYLTRKKCRGTDWSARTLINLEVDDEGVPQSINSEEPSLIVLEDDLAIKVTIVTDEEVTPEKRDD